MPNIGITVKNKIATGDGTIIVCGNSNYVVKFTFDSEWANLTQKTMRVIVNGQHTDTVFSGTQCNLPILSNATSCEIGVFAGNLETSTRAKFDCKRSIKCGSNSPASPTTSVYNQIIALLNGFSATVAKTGNTSTITIKDPTGTHTAQVTDGASGVGISSIAFKESTSSGNVYTITMTDGDTYEITAPKGDPAASSYDDTALAGRVTTIEGKESGWDSKYDKPSGGIPKTDLTSEVQSSLDKADTAIQSHQDISGKVDKVQGKQLSTEDFTTAEKTKLASALTEHQSLSAYRTSADQDTIDATKLTEPSTGLAVGKYFRIASIDASGHAVLEAVEIPYKSLRSEMHMGFGYGVKVAGEVAYNWSASFGQLSEAYGNNSLSVGSNSWAHYDCSTAIGASAHASNASVALGDGSVATADQFVVGAGNKHHLLLNFSTGLIPFARMNNTKTAMDAVAVAGAQYYLGVQSAVSITLPATALAGQEIVVVFYSGSTAATLTVSGTVIGDTPTPAANQRIELNYLWDGVAWCLVSKVDAYEAVSE